MTQDQELLTDYEDGPAVHFSSRVPRHRALIIPDRTRARRRSFRKRKVPCPVRGFAHRRNHDVHW